MTTTSLKLIDAGLKLTTVQVIGVGGPNFCVHDRQGTHNYKFNSTNRPAGVTSGTCP
jgi:hypothetical protein